MYGGRWSEGGWRCGEGGGGGARETGGVVEVGVWMEKMPAIKITG